MTVALHLLVSVLLIQGGAIRPLGLGRGVESQFDVVCPVAFGDGEQVELSDGQSVDLIPVPLERDRRRARLDLRRQFRVEYARHEQLDQLALANEFLTRAADETTAPIERYALLEEAMDLAVLASSQPVVCAVAVAMGEIFQVDNLELRYDNLERIHRADRQAGAGMEAIAYMVRLAQDARLGRNFSIADRSLDRAEGYSRKLKDEHLEEELGRMRSRLDWEKGCWKKASRAADSRAQATYGFFIEGELGQAVDMLRPDEEGTSSGADSLDSRLAQIEVADPQSAVSQLALAKLWMQRGAEGKWVDVLPFKRRGVTWYMKAMKGLPMGLEYRSAEREVVEFYRAHHDPIRGVPIDPWERPSGLTEESLAVARSVIWHDFSILTDRRWTYSKHSVYLHNLCAEPLWDDRLRGHLSLLCVDEAGVVSVIRRKHVYRAGRLGLLGTNENAAEVVVTGAQGEIANSLIEGQNGGDWIPKNAHLLITLDGAPVFESLWKEPESLWWLE